MDTLYRCYCDKCMNSFPTMTISRFTDTVSHRRSFEPSGGNNPLPSLPDTPTLEESNIDDAIVFFEDFINTLPSLLHAIAIGFRFAEDPPLYNDVQGEWEWHYDDYTYRIEGEIVDAVDEEAKNDLHVAFLDFYIALLLEETTSLLLEKTTIQTWYADTRNHIQNAWISQYLLGVGGKNVLVISDVEFLRLEGIKGQWEFFKKFTEEIKNGELTPARILQRIALYGEATTQGYERAKAKSHNITLPEYPADGNQICFTNCRCHWRLEDDGDYVNAFWVVNPTAEHCRSCLDNARKWNPLRVRKNYA